MRMRLLETVVLVQHLSMELPHLVDLAVVLVRAEDILPKSYKLLAACLRLFVESRFDDKH